MTYTRDEDLITITMDSADYANLIVITGYAVGSAFKEGEMKMAYGFVRFINELNATNPAYIPYEIPEKYITRSN
jgi:hypothetical protein